MKKLFILLLIVLFYVQNGFGQRKEPVLNNSVKFEMLNAVYGDYSLTYERMIKLRTSINFRVGYLSLYDFATGNDFFTVNGKSTGFTTSLEYRYFLSKKNGVEGEGFYLGGYARYVGFNLLEISSQEIPFSLKSDLSYVGLGFHFGVQQSLRKLIYANSNFAEQLKRIVFDFHLVGFGIDCYALKFGLHAVAPEVYDESKYAELLDYVYEKYPLLPKLPEIDYSLLNISKSIKVPFWWPGIKLGFSVGYKF